VTVRPETKLLPNTRYVLVAHRRYRLAGEIDVNPPASAAALDG